MNPGTIEKQTSPQSRIPRHLMGAPETFWSPTLLLFLGCLSLGGLGVWGYVYWGWWKAVPFMINLLIFYVLGTVLHDAAHGVAHRSRWMNEWIGITAALLQGFALPIFRRTHNQHHANTNDPKKDPDYYVSTGGGLWTMSFRFAHHELFFFKHKLYQKNDLLVWGLTRVLQIAMLVTVWKMGIMIELCNLWLTPALICGHLLVLFFDYIPHRPFVDTARWRDTRVYPGTWTNIVLLGQNYHLVHHLWPTVPWYRYQQAYFYTEDQLRANGSQFGIFRPSKMQDS